jgi:23S rRNA pseudouridine1911/1915/1917 synthase
MAKHRVELPAGSCTRVDRLLAASLPGLSRRSLRRLLDQGAIRVDGRRARKGEMLSGARVVEIEVPDAPAPEPAAEPEPAIPILFLDASCVALDKPAGRPGHALRPGESGTVANFLAARFPECLGAGDTPLEAGLVHRLDTGTSGVLLAARDRRAWRELREQFRSGRVAKHYLALVAGSVQAPGEVRRPIEPHPRSRRKVRVLAEGETSRRARPAATVYRPRAGSSRATLLEVEIPTGVMHQIRAHLAAIGHPVLGDLLYGGGPVPEGRHFLHAARLVFDHPRSGARIDVRSPLPADFEAALHRIGLELPEAAGRCRS